MGVELDVCHGQHERGISLVAPDEEVARIASVSVTVFFELFLELGWVLDQGWVGQEEIVQALFAQLLQSWRIGRRSWDDDGMGDDGRGRRRRRLACHAGAVGIDDGAAQGDQATTGWNDEKYNGNDIVSWAVMLHLAFSAEDARRPTKPAPAPLPGAHLGQDGAPVPARDADQQPVKPNCLEG